MKYRFEQFVLDTDQFELRQNDLLLKVEPQVIELLVLLVSNSDRLISKDEIMEKVWNGRVVTDASLSSRIRTARRVLGDNGINQKMIRTIHKKGYSFVAQVRTEESESRFSLVENENKEDLKIPSIAVLPFQNISADVEHELLTDGITEDTITALSMFSNLMVIARSSTAAYKGRVVDVKQVGREQGVRYVLEGSVRKVAEKVRVTASLIDSTTSHPIWSQRYDRMLDDIFLAQDELVREIVVALDVTLGEGEQARVWSRGTSNVAAWENFRLAAGMILGDHDGNLQEAKRSLETALELDPMYANAWAMMGWYHHYYYDVGAGLREAYDCDTALEQMKKCALKAVKIDSRCSDGYSVLAKYYLELKEFDLAIENAEKSIILAPGNAGNLVEAAGLMVKSGHPQRGLELVRRAMRLCPLYRAGFLRSLSRALRFSGDSEAAVAALRESLVRQPEILIAHVNLASLLGELGRKEAAQAAARDVIRLSPSFTINEYMEGLSYRFDADKKRVEQGLRAAGLPE